MEIENYLNGLDNIVIGNSTKKFGNPYCEEPAYGHLSIVINKMMGGSSDIELQKELM
jgi:hypothetical protein